MEASQRAGSSPAVRPLPFSWARSLCFTMGPVRSTVQFCLRTNRRNRSFNWCAGDKLGALVAEMERSCDVRARLRTRLAHLRASGSPIRMFTWERDGGTAKPNVSHAAEVPKKPKRQQPRPCAARSTPRRLLVRESRVRLAASPLGYLEQAINLRPGFPTGRIENRFFTLAAEQRSDSATKPV